MPALGFGNSVGSAGVNVLPPSADSARQTFRGFFDRIRATTRPSLASNNVGWIWSCPPRALNGFDRSHVAPPSAERSANGGQERQLSTDVPARTVPPLRRIGSARTGP